ncbi:MAG: TIGR00297 family protein [Halobaculum sp.]
MRQQLRRAGGFAVVATLVLAAPALGPAAAAPFAAVALLAAFVVDDGWLFELFARPADRKQQRLDGLTGFALAGTGLAVLTALPRAPMPVPVFAAAVVTLAYGRLGRQFVRESTTDQFLTTGAFVAVGFLAGTVAQAAVVAASPAVGSVSRLPTYAFLAAVGALVAALLRSVLFEDDDPLVIVSVGFLLWLFEAITPAITPLAIGVGLGVTVALGWISYALRTADVPGMLTGVLLGLVTVVLGGFGWFAVLISFFGIGGLASKFRYDDKLQRGVAQENEGARGTGNVLGNAAVALLSVVIYAGVEETTLSASLVGAELALASLAVAGVPLSSLVAVAFAGSVAAAMADTLASEVGGLFDDPRLITSLERVEPGTDGAVTWQGELAGTAGSGLVAALAAVGMSLPGAPVAAAAVVLVGGVAGMTVDSLCGAVIEGSVVGNEGVNFLATLGGATVSVLLGVVVL